MIQAFDQQKPLSQLRLRWAATALLWSLFLVFGYHLLAAEWRVSLAWQWLLQAGAGCIYLLAVLWRSLEYNHRLGETQLLPSFGAGNVMTLLRGGLVAAMLGFLFMPSPEGWKAWLPAVLYTLASLADFLDGYLARVTNHATRLGEMLDINIDGLGILAASLLAIQYSQIPAWYLLVALARYLFLGGIWLRKALRKPVYDLPPSVRRRAFAGVQMGFLFFILTPLFSPPGTHIAAALFALPFLVGFIVDWLIVSGAIKLQPASQAAGARLRSMAQTIVLDWLPVGLRLLAAVLLADQLVQSLSVNPGTGSLNAALAGLPPNTGLLAISLGQALVLVLLAVGAGGRIVSIAGLCLIGFQQMTASLTSPQIALAAILTAILYLGTGSLSVWKPEERLIYRRAGERPA